MKLLGWVHRKLRHSTSEFTIGGGQQQQSQDDQQFYPTRRQQQYYGSKPIRQTGGHIEDNFRKSFGGLSRSVDDERDRDYGGDEDNDGRSSSTVSDLFHGFLAIGTLGGSTHDPSAAGGIIKEATTPTFRFSVEEITEKQLETEVTENELKLINDELERVLGGDINNDSSSSRRNSHVSTARNSHVSSAGRSSHVSTGSNITVLCSSSSSNAVKQPSSSDLIIDGNTTSICPLQGYLLGSGINSNEKMTKKEYRTSLGELFQKEIKRSEQKESPVYLMKKMLKKKIQTKYAANDCAETKLRKMMHVFHKKVHPEKRMVKKNNNNVSSYEYNDDGDEDIILIPQRSLLSKRRYKKHFTTTTTCESESKEHWIKTDADYLVLEL